MTRNVGLRLMIDTMLGANDGAPLRAGERAIVSDTMLSGGEIPDYWQAFDSMVEPSVTAQGTMAGGELTPPPGQIAFSDWGSFADNLWDVDLVPGREFVRSKESDLDSAVAMYWMPALLAPRPGKALRNLLRTRRNYACARQTCAWNDCASGGRALC